MKGSQDLISQLFLSGAAVSLLGQIIIAQIRRFLLIDFVLADCGAWQVLIRFCHKHLVKNCQRKEEVDSKGNSAVRNTIVPLPKLKSSFPVAGKPALLAECCGILILIMMIRMISALVANIKYDEESLAL